MNPVVQDYLDQLYLCVYERMSSGIVVNQPFLRQLAEVYCSTIEFREMGLFSCIPLCDVVLKPDSDGTGCAPNCDIPVIVLPEDAIDPCEPEDPCPPATPFVAQYLVRIRAAETCAAPCFSTAPLPTAELELYVNNEPLVQEFVSIVKRLLPANNCYCFDIPTERAYTFGGDFFTYGDVPITYSGP